MKLILDNKKFNEEIAIFNTILTNTSANPLLSCLLLETNGNNLEITGSNEEVAVKTTINKHLEIVKPGKILIEGNSFLKILSKISENKIEIELVDEQILKIKTETFNMDLNLLNCDDYPHYDFNTENKSSGIINVDFFAKIANKLVRIASSKKNEISINKVLMGVLIDSKRTDNFIEAAATDSHYLAYIKDKYDGPKFRITMNVETIKLITSQAKEKKFNFYLGEQNRVIIENDNIKYISRLIEGDYPNIEKFIQNNELPNEFVIDRRLITKAIEKAIIVSEDPSSSKTMISIEVKNEQIQIKAQNLQKGIMFEVIKIKGKINEETTIILNAASLLNLLKNIDDANVTVKFTNNLSPIYLFDDKNHNYSSLILPARS
ncbi:MAG: DNA polymerase III subunit beta [Mycoplasmataceae bacterium]|jgi:DNA polymerase-3 subunit beta|nr:DNA polymerase III subunit beta [Mycoplasmataceae bacterium]